MKTIADTWLRHNQTRSDDDFWAWEEANEIICKGKNLDRAWNITLLLLQSATIDRDLFSVAAGPLEDLIDVYGNSALDLIEEAFKNNSRLQLALSTVDVLFYYPEFDRWYELLRQYGFREHRFAPPGVVNDVIKLMESYLSGDLGADDYGRNVQKLLDTPLADKTAQRILQAACCDIELFQLDRLKDNVTPSIPKGFLHRPTVQEPGLRAKVEQSVAALKAAGYNRT